MALDIVVKIIVLLMVVGYAAMVHIAFFTNHEDINQAYEVILLALLTVTLIAVKLWTGWREGREKCSTCEDGYEKLVECKVEGLEGRCYGPVGDSRDTIVGEEKSK